METECVFCKIIKGEIDSAKIWENDGFLAFLDVQPAVRGMTIVVPKKHFSSYVFEMPEDIYREFLSSGQKVAKLLKKALRVKRVFMVIEGLDVNHAHIKLYPVPEPVKPLGKILTPGADMKAIQELKNLAKAIRNTNI